MALNHNLHRQHLLIRAAAVTLWMLAGIGLVILIAGFPKTGIAVALLAGIPAIGIVGYEFVHGMLSLRGDRSSAGVQVVVQVALAIVLLLGVNALALRHYARFDWTRDRLFTLSPDVQQKLRQLNGETTVVVYQRHKTFGRLSDRPDRYDYAAEKKVAEKVKDLVQQLREFGPQFKVVELDVEEEDFDKKYEDLTRPKGQPPRDDLRKALDDTPENSIFFYSYDEGAKKSSVQRLSFNAFYQLDKTSSKEDNDHVGNLVLRHHNRGVDAFTDRVLNIDTKRPKVAILVVHELLSTREQEPYSLKGLGTSLKNNGFEVVDILLKKDLREPVVYTFDESKFDSFEDELKSLKSSIEEIEAALKQFDAQLKKIETDEEALASTLARRQITAKLNELGGFLSEEDFNRVVKQLQEEYKKAIKDPKNDRARFMKAARDYLEGTQKLLKNELAKAQTDERKTTQERDALNVESATELRRMTDLTAKLKRLLADCDLVILPRFTVHSVIPPFVLPNDLHQMDKAHVDALKAFMAEGKPVLACFGPPADPRPIPPMGMRPNDGIEDLFDQLNIKLGKQTILFKSEAKSLAAAQQEFSVARVSGDVPPVQFDWPRQLDDDLPAASEKKGEPLLPNPIQEDMQLASRSVGTDLDLQVRYGRPVYYLGNDRNKLQWEPEFMQTDKRSWNEDRPFPMGKSYRPTPPKEDAARGSLMGKGNGPFTLGVAVEKVVPMNWYGSKDAAPTKVRVAVIGHGGIFSGAELTPVKEKLLVDTCNWLIGRDDLLARQERPDPNRGLWKFPRLENFSENEKSLWNLGMQIVLPVFFIYLMVVVLMVRHLR